MIQKIKKALLDLLFPPFCVYCKKEGGFLCPGCVKDLNKKKIVQGYCKKGIKSCSGNPDSVIYTLDYAKNPMIKAAIKQMKYKFTQELAEQLGRLASEKIAELGMVKNRKINLIPVPLHKRRLNQRGFNQAEMISESIVKHLPDKNIKISNALVRIKDTGHQAGSGKKRRHKNLKGAFSMNKKFVQKYDPKEIYFLVDDVCTTGSTLENCAKVLKENGYEKVYGLVIARVF